VTKVPGRTLADDPPTRLNAHHGMAEDLLTGCEAFRPRCSQGLVLTAVPGLSCGQAASSHVAQSSLQAYGFYAQEVTRER
jgi:hypothetical protein